MYLAVHYFAEQPINIFSGINMNMIPNGNIVNNINSLRLLLPSEGDGEVDFRLGEPIIIPTQDVAKRQVIFGPLGPLVPLGALAMICEVLPGYENPFWEISNNNRIMNPVGNQTVTNASGSEIASIIVISSSSTAMLVVNISPTEEFPDELNGTYTCKAPNSNISSSVTLTNSEQLTNIITIVIFYIISAM